MDRIGRVITGLRERSSSLAIGLTLAVVAATTGFVSYTHISALTLDLGQSWKTAHLYPLFIDGQIVIGSVYYMTREGKRKWLGLLGIVPGVLESLFANWQSSGATGGWLHVYESHAWATVAAQAFAVSSFLFERWLKDRAAERAPAVQPQVQTVVQEDVQAAVQENVHELEPEPAPEAEPEPVPDAEPLREEHHEPPRLLPPLSPPVKDDPWAPASPPDADDPRLPLPEDPDELRELVLSTPGNALSKTHRITRYRYGQLKTQFQNEGVRVA